MRSISTPLKLEAFGFAFGERTIVRAVDLEIAPRAIHWLLGPVGSGKSSLLRVLAGQTGSARVHTWGRAAYLGAPLGDLGRPALAEQHARLVVGTTLHAVVDGLATRAVLTPAEQRDAISALLVDLGLAELAARLDAPVVDLAPVDRRALAIARAFATGSMVICVDEPTAKFERADVNRLLAIIDRIAATRSVLAVTHDQQVVRALGGSAALLAGGIVQERGAAGALLEQPQTPAGRQFASTGGCTAPSPDAVAEELSEEAVQHLPPVQTGHLRWVLPGLAGLCRPGLIRDLAYDLDVLVTEGVTVLVGLEERETVPIEELRRRGIRSDRLAIPDMQAPSEDEASALCERIEGYLARGDRVGVHCRGGLGRTGTILAAYLIRRGATAAEALSKVRIVEPRFVQSVAQVEFLRAFARLRRAPAAESAT